MSTQKIGPNVEVVRLGAIEGLPEEVAGLTIVIVRHTGAYPPGAHVAIVEDEGPLGMTAVIENKLPHVQLFPRGKHDGIADYIRGILWTADELERVQVLGEERMQALAETEH